MDEINLNEIIVFGIISVIDNIKDYLNPYKTDNKIQNFITVVDILNKLESITDNRKYPIISSSVNGLLTKSILHLVLMTLRTIVPSALVVSRPLFFETSYQAAFD